MVNGLKPRKKSGVTEQQNLNAAAIQAASFIKNTLENLKEDKHD